jgi:hypothetical protein
MLSVPVKATLVVNPTVQVVGVAPATIEDPEKVTPDTCPVGSAAAGRASRVAPRPPASKPSTTAIGKNVVNRRGRSCCRAVLLSIELAAFSIIDPPLIQPNRPVSLGSTGRLSSSLQKP